MRRAVLLFGLLFGLRAHAETPLAPSTIVVYNKNIPESGELAKFYAEKRGIARDHFVPLDCSPNEEIDRDEYDATIRNPLRQTFEQRGWWKLDRNGETPRVIQSAIHFVALIKGVPLKIRSTTHPDPADRVALNPVGSRNEASVDSEIGALGALSPQISGVLPNPYFQSYRAITEIDAPQLLLVSRLDAPTVATVRQMISDAVETERAGLWGRAYIDSAHNTFGAMHLGDEWLEHIADELHKAGVPVIYENTPALFPDGYPVSDCALYYGWYAETATGPFAQPWFRFTRGAVAVHIHSFSAATLRDPNAHWAGPLLTKGAAATLGNVYEPYLQFTAHLDIFSDRLLHGFTLAESSAMATPALSWMNITIGDPLYRPYGGWLQLEKKPEGNQPTNPWQAYHEFTTQNANRSAPEFRNLARQFALRTRNAPMLEDIGLLEMRENNFAAAANAFSQARGIYSQRDDILRVVLEESDAWLQQNKPKRALELVRSAQRIVIDAPAAALLKHIEQEARGALSNVPKRP